VKENNPQNCGLKDDINKNNPQFCGLNETQKQILLLIEENKYVTKHEISKKLNLSERKIEYVFKDFKDKELIERIGSRKKGYWQITKAIKDGLNN
jgi:predicted HTH transcriptional regulator